MGMIDRFVKRLEEQKRVNAIIPTRAQLVQSFENEVEEAEYNLKEIEKDDPLTPQEVRYYLEKLEKETNKDMEETPNSITFDSIQNFCAWYEPQRDSFLDKQKAPFDTLTQTKGMINLGCACKIHVRQKMADEYYKNFFTKNQTTDLIPKIKEVAKVETIIFKIGSEEFLKI